MDADSASTSYPLHWLPRTCETCAAAIASIWKSIWSHAMLFARWVTPFPEARPRTRASRSLGFARGWSGAFVAPLTLGSCWPINAPYGAWTNNDRANLKPSRIGAGRPSAAGSALFEISVRKITLFITARYAGITFEIRHSMYQIAVAWRNFVYPSKDALDRGPHRAAAAIDDVDAGWSGKA